MYSNGRARLNTSILRNFLIILVLSGCGRSAKSPLSIDEALSEGVLVPVHHLASDSATDYENLDVVYYYYFDSSPEVRLDTFFTLENSEGGRVRVARMSTYNLNGQLVNTDETKGGPPVSITWAREGKGFPCKVLSRAYRNDSISGDPFRSCLYWLDEDLYQYKFYSVWSLEETVRFVNSLVVLEKSSE
jgi:hypothetical protein